MTEKLISRPGLITGVSLTLAGLILQLLIGPVRWQALDTPVNFILLAAFPAILFTTYRIFGNSSAVMWLGSARAASASIAWTLVMMLTMGLIRQQPLPMGFEDMPAYLHFPGLHDMRTNWSFVLIFLWLLTALGMALIRVCIPLKIKRIAFLLNHLGLFVALLAGALGTPQNRHYRLTLKEGESSSQIIDPVGQPHAIPFTIELKDFDVTFYESDDYDRSNQIPKKFVSTVGISKSGKQDGTYSISVNHPARIGHWRVYQYGYDTGSDPEHAASTFEIVCNPWHGLFLTGILIMFAGAIALFVQTSKRKETAV